MSTMIGSRFGQFRNRLQARLSLLKWLTSQRDPGLLSGKPNGPIAPAASSRLYRWMQVASTSPIPSSATGAAASSPNNDGTGVSGIKTFFITAAILCLLWVFGVAFAILLDGA